MRDARARQALICRVEITSALVSLDGGHGLPAKDVPILAAAVASHGDVLLTGDIEDFGHVIGRTLRGVRILTASMLLTEIAPPARLRPELRSISTDPCDWLHP